jgi:hypothetical protein
MWYPCKSNLRTAGDPHQCGSCRSHIAGPNPVSPTLTAFENFFIVSGESPKIPRHAILDQIN